MKKGLSVVCSILLALVLCVSAFAQSDAALKVDTALADGTLTVTLSAPAGSSLATFETVLNYDAEKLELTDVVYGAGDMTTQNTETAGKVHLLMVWQDTQEDAATLATVTFKVKDGAKGETAISFTDTAATDGNDAPIAVSLGESNTFSVKLSDAPPTDEKIPSTAGTYIAVGLGCTVTVAAAIAVTAGAFVKRKKTAE